VVTRTEELLKSKKWKIKLAMLVCAHCGMCAESCFLYLSNGKNPKFSPSYKFLNSTGTMYRKRGKVTEKEMAEVKENAFKRCALCMRCYCPLGLNIPEMIALARSLCRSQGVAPDYSKEL